MRLKAIIILFMPDKVKRLLYVDDINFWARNDDDIHDLAMELLYLVVDL